MMHREACSIFGIKDVCKEDHPFIISTHDVISFNLKIPANLLLENEDAVIKSSPIVSKRLVWEDADIEQYQQTLETILE